MILIIHAHPDPESFTLSIAGEIARSLETADKATRTVDLYRLPTPFPPILEADELHRKTSLNSVVQTQMNLVEKADGYIVVHPDWWGGPPAVLKGWLDRVLRPGTAYEVPQGYGHRKAEGLLNGRRALVVCTGDADNAGPLEEFWIQRVWAFCGVEARLSYFPRLRESNLAMRRAFVAQSAAIAVDIFG